jgi:HPt (histidine-containing phosphotransfer) domain-containing protein
MTQLSYAGSPLYCDLSLDPEFATVVAWFVGDLPDRIAELQENVAAGDWEGLQQTVHRLKGAGGSFGFGPITAAAAAVERAIEPRQSAAAILLAVEALVDLCRRARVSRPAD